LYVFKHIFPNFTIEIQQKYLPHAEVRHINYNHNWLNTDRKTQYFVRVLYKNKTERAFRARLIPSVSSNSSGSAAARLLGLRVRIPLWEWMSLSVVFCEVDVSAFG
jgi:hypothetical protein